MEYEVAFTDSAKKDLFDIYFYIAMNDSFEAADKIKNRIEQKCVTLKKFPKRGIKIKEIYDDYPDICQLISKPYHILYKIVQKRVIILAILDGRRDIQQILIERTLR